MESELSLCYIMEYGEDMPLFAYRRFKANNVYVQNENILASVEDVQAAFNQPGYDLVAYDEMKNLREMNRSLLELFDYFNDDSCLTGNGVNLILTDDVISDWCIKHGMPSNLHFYNAEAFRMRVQLLMTALCGYLAAEGDGENAKKYIRVACNGYYPAYIRYLYYSFPDRKKRDELFETLRPSMESFPKIDDINTLSPGELKLKFYKCAPALLQPLLDGLHPHVASETLITGKPSIGGVRVVWAAVDIFSALAYSIACAMAGKDKKSEICKGCGAYFTKKARRSSYCDRCNRKTVFSRRDRAMRKTGGKSNEQASEQ